MTKLRNIEQARSQDFAQGGGGGGGASKGPLPERSKGPFSSVERAPFLSADLHSAQGSFERPWGPLVFQRGPWWP